MIKNCIVGDVAYICRKENKTQSDIAKELGVTREAICRRSRGQIISKGFVELMEMLGYDIEINYVKREVSE